MDAVLETDRCVAFRVDAEAWRDPDITWSDEDLLQLAAAAAVCEGPSALVLDALGRILPAEHLSSWAIITIDAGGGIHRGEDDSSDAGLCARAVTWLWSSGVSSEAFGDGAAYVETWSSSGGAEAIACVPLVSGGVIESLVAVWLTANDTDTILGDVARLTLLGRLWSGGQRDSVRSSESDGDSRLVMSTDLTRRQFVILQHMAKGLTNAQIAREIRFSESTVRLESMCIYRYFGVHSRSEAVEAARAAGVLQMSVSAEDALGAGPHPVSRS